MAYLLKKLPGAPANYAVKFEGVLVQITAEGVVFPSKLPAMVDPWISIEEGKTFKGALSWKDQANAQDTKAAAKIASDAKLTADRAKAEALAKQKAAAKKAAAKKGKAPAKSKKKVAKKVAKKAATKKKATKKKATKKKAKKKG